MRNLSVASLSMALVLATACGSPTDGYEPKNWEAMPVKTVDQPTLQATADGIDEFSVQASLEHLSGQSPAPLSSGSVTIAERGGTQGRAYARQYIRETFESYGLVVNEHQFTTSSGRSGTNVEGIIPGTSEGRHLYVTAHLDSVSNKGANDNATGVTALLLAARALSQHRPRDTIHLVAVDLEELGLYGSYYYVRDKVLPLQKKDPESIIGNINADMIGYTTGLNSVVLSDCESEGNLGSAITAGVVELGLNLNLMPTSCSGRSDHMSFYDEGIEALFAIDASYHGYYPWYHEVTDTIDKVNAGFLTEVIRALTAGAMKLAYPQKA